MSITVAVTETTTAVSTTENVAQLDTALEDVTVATTTTSTAVSVAPLLIQGLTTVTETDLAFTDVTTGNASTSKHGLMPKLTGSTTTFFRSDGTQATPAGGVVGGEYDVTDHGLVADGSTDNTAALQALINTIPTTGNGRHATFLWPYSSAGQYVFASQVDWGLRGIRNVGVGVPHMNSPFYSTAIMAGADNFTMFSIDGGASGGAVGPSFENFFFGANSHTGVKAMNVQRMNRCHLHTVSFSGLACGLRWDANGVDCAYHTLHNVHFYNCSAGLLAARAVNHCYVDAYALNCTVGLDLLSADQNQIKFQGSVIGVGTIAIRLGLNGTDGVTNGTTTFTSTRGGFTAAHVGSLIWVASTQYTINAVTDTNTITLSATASSATGQEWHVGSNTQSGYENDIWAAIELGTTNGPRTCVQINGRSTSTTGNGNRLTLFLHGGDDTKNNVGLDITSGANDNIYEIPWQSAFASGKLVQDNGLRNRRAGCPMIGTAANRPSATQNNRGLEWFATDTGTLSLSDGSSWHTIATGI